MRGGKVWKHGGKWEGIVPQLLSQFKKATAGPRRMQLEKYMRVVRCPACQGMRLNAQARAAQAGGRTLIELGRMPIGELVPWFERYERDLPPAAKAIAGELLKEIRARLTFLVDVGLDYLTLARASGTLSGGESQRIRLASQIGSGLTGVLYVLDEPSIGLHQRDNDRLLATLKHLRDLGNTVIVVEHDEDAVRALAQGARGVIVSNHGGRQLDSAAASLDALPAVVEAVAGQGEVLLDGGVRRGTDVIKALALGARAVMIGRPFLFGLVAGGEAGAARVLELLRAELALDLLLCGRPSVAALDRSLLVPADMSARRPALTASRHGADRDAWAGTEKRASRPNKETTRETASVAP